MIERPLWLVRAMSRLEAEAQHDGDAVMVKMDSVRREFDRGDVWRQSFPAIDPELGHTVHEDAPRTFAPPLVPLPLPVTRGELDALREDVRELARAHTSLGSWTEIRRIAEGR